MDKNRSDNANREKENQPMKCTNVSQRPCSIADSIAGSCMEVKKMRTGKLPENSLDQLFSNIEQWCNEEGE